jgi:hypothetical protein
MSTKQGALLIRPKNNEESEFIGRLIERLGVKSHRLSEEDVLDLGLSLMMRKADRTKVSDDVLPSVDRTLDQQNKEGQGWFPLGIQH